MNDQLLPDSIPIATAAAIVGMSPATFKAHCIAASGPVPVVNGRIAPTSLATNWADPYIATTRRLASGLVLVVDGGRRRD